MLSYNAQVVFNHCTHHLPSLKLWVYTQRIKYVTQAGVCNLSKRDRDNSLSGSMSLKQHVGYSNKVGGVHGHENSCMW